MPFPIKGPETVINVCSVLCDSEPNPRAVVYPVALINPAVNGFFQRDEFGIKQRICLRSPRTYLLFSAVAFGRETPCLWEPDYTETFHSLLSGRGAGGCVSELTYRNIQQHISSLSVCSKAKPHTWTTARVSRSTSLFIYINLVCCLFVLKCDTKVVRWEYKNYWNIKTIWLFRCCSVMVQEMWCCDVSSQLCLSFNIFSDVAQSVEVKNVYYWYKIG